MASGKARSLFNLSYNPTEHRRLCRYASTASAPPTGGVQLFKSMVGGEGGMMAVFGIKPIDERVSKKTGGKCFYCGARFDRHIYMVKDHFVPKSNAGLSTFDNLVPACVRCNGIKSNLSLEGFRDKAKLTDQNPLRYYAKCDGLVLADGLFYFEREGLQP